jgi:hypothetical protein
MMLDKQGPDESEWALDAGIRRAVLILRAGGIETFESCESGDGHSFLEPTVRFHGDSWAGYKAFAIAMENGLAVSELRRAYAAQDGQLNGPWWEMTFRHTTGRGR